MPCWGPFETFSHVILKLAWLRSLSWVAQQVNAEPMDTLGLLFFLQALLISTAPGPGRGQDERCHLPARFSWAYLNLHPGLGTGTDGSLQTPAVFISHQNEVHIQG